MAKLWTPQELKKLGEIQKEVLKHGDVIISTYRELYPRHSNEGILRESMIDRFRVLDPSRSREGIRSQLRLLKAGAEAAKSYGVFDSCGMLTTCPTLTKAKETAKHNALETGRTTLVAALICSFEVEQKIIEKVY